MRANSRRDFLKFGALSAASTIFVPREVFSKYEAQADDSGNDVVLRCCVMSDVHFNGNPESKETVRFRRAIQFMYEYSAGQPYTKFDALMVVGDMTNHGTEPELTLFKKELDAAVKPGTEKLICMGNHEFYGGSVPYWKSVMQLEPNRHYDVNGYRFISVSPEKGTMADGDYLYAVDWLKNELDEATKLDPEKPIFVFQHYPVSPTVYGGRGTDDWGAEDLFETLQHYPKVIDFSGHTHYPINNPRCAWQGCFTAFGTGTLSYLCHGHEGRRFSEAQPNDGAYGQFYVMEVRRDHSVTLKPYDLTTDSFFDLVYFVAKPGDLDKYEYTDARYFTSEKPTWDADTKVKYDISDLEVALELKQARSKDVVVGYRVELEQQDAASKEWNAGGAFYFWSRYHERNMPETVRCVLDPLEPSSNYRGKIVAYNAFMLESEESIPIAFTTPADPDAPEDRDAPAPKANYIDLAVVGGALANTPSSDWAKGREWKKGGKPAIVKDEAAGGSVFQFDGKSYYRAECKAEDYKRMRRVTIGAKFFVDPKSTGDRCVLCGTQIGGFGLGYNGDKKCARFWVYVDGGIKTLDAPAPAGEYITVYAVFDGKDLILYVNGKEASRMSAKGRLTHTNNDSAKAFVLGGDAAVGGGAECLLQGRVAYAKLYTWALNAEQVANLSK